ncbi:hypothetical protein [Sphingobium sp. BS19]|uniref:hypothetical protein n=1 Tax=Sphingobium sp. BS19 TaxID=3018973 RepID=UPI0022EE1872|nr:hypothetical protein [Sphingobium sp. BS19]GLI99145.1 hypothetical protein Sbs19_29630 [Sphingobium sp. BS19]
MSRRTLQELLAEAYATAVERDKAAETGPLVRVEHAAQVCEEADFYRKYDHGEKSEDFLDGYIQGIERAAELVRMIGATSPAKKSQ